MQAVLSAASCADSVEWETITCPLCGGDDEEQVLRKRSEQERIDCRMARCRCCGMVYLNPRPTKETIGYFYPDNYEAYRAPRDRNSLSKRLRDWIERLILTELRGYPGPSNNWRHVLARLAAPCFAPDRASHTSVPFHGKGRLLDVGCGGGWFAHRMQRRGWNVTGLDFSPRAVAMIKEHYGIPAYQGTLPHPAIKRESFDVVNMGAVLEHVHDPHETIAAARASLQPGGLLVISVPNLASWGYRHFGEDWHPLCLPHHLLHFTPASLSKLMGVHGMTVKELRIVGRASWMRRSLKLREQRLGKSLSTRAQKLRMIPSLMNSWSIWRGQGDCLFLIAQREEINHG